MGDDVMVTKYAKPAHRRAVRAKHKRVLKTNKAKGVYRKGNMEAESAQWAALTGAIPLKEGLRGQTVVQVKQQIQQAQQAQQLLAQQKAQWQKLQKQQAYKQKYMKLKTGYMRAIKYRSSPMPSSWVDTLGYDDSTMTLIAELSGKRYAWRPIEKVVFDLWVAGTGACRTEDTQENPPRWIIGETPSLGAAWWYTIAPLLKGKRVK